jgi:hypothetical protein
LFSLLFVCCVNAQTSPVWTDDSTIRIAQEIQQCREMKTTLIPSYIEATKTQEARVKSLEDIIAKDERIIQLLNERDSLWKQRDELRDSHEKFMKTMFDIQNEMAIKGLKDVKPGVIETAKTMSIGALIALAVKSLFVLF